MAEPPLTYRRAGVDVAKASRLLRALRPLIRSTPQRGVLTQLDAFSGIMEVPTRFRHPCVVASTDGVGTKIKIAQLCHRHNTVGIDLVAMNVNDVLTTGAEPWFFLDYIAMGKLKADVYRALLAGVVRGCREAGCALIGGETAEMPGVYGPGEYDLAGFCVGLVERSRIIDGRTIQPGDQLIGLASTGLHANGFSLVRTIFSRQEQRVRARELLEPTKIYTRAVKALKRHVNIKGMAHITGGAFFEKLPRIARHHVSLVIHRGSWPIPPIFCEIQRRARLSEREMFGTFNMGIGMVVVVSADEADRALRVLATSRQRAWLVGEVVKGAGVVIR